MGDIDICLAEEREGGSETGASDLKAMLDCCHDWKPGLAKIDNFIVLQSIRAGKDVYDGKAFNFCPWCGAKKFNASLSGGASAPSDSKR